MNAKNLLVAGLIILNVVLVVCLITGRAPDVVMAPAFAQNRNVAGGGFAATTANLTTSRQALWMIDNTDKIMLIYAFPAGKGQGLQVVAKRDLRIDFGAGLAGDLMVIPGQYSSGIETVYVIDPVGKQMVVYLITENRPLEILSKHDLGKDFKTGK